MNQRTGSIRRGHTGGGLGEPASVLLHALVRFASWADAGFASRKPVTDPPPAEEETPAEDQASEASPRTEQTETGATPRGRRLATSLVFATGF